MGFITGCREFEAEALTITLASLGNTDARISTQYSFDFGSNSPIYPTKGWLDIKFTTGAGALGANDVSFYIAPGTSGAVVGGLSVTDAELSVLAAADRNLMYFLGAMEGGQMSVDTQFHRRFMVGFDASFAYNPHNSNTTAPTNWNDNLFTKGQLPRFWSLVVLNNLGATGAFAAAGHSATFTPVFDYVVSA